MTHRESAGIWRLFGSTTEEITCTVDIEHSFDSLHAHAIPEGVELRPGDVVVVHDPPVDVPFGRSVQTVCRATLHRAGALERAWMQAVALLELTELYHCGFEPKEAVA